MSTGSPPAPEEFLSGETGHVAGIRRTVSRTIGDSLLDLRARRALHEIDDLVKTTPRRRVLGLSVFRPGSALIDAAVEELQTTRHDLKLELGSTATLTGGKFQNLNLLLEEANSEFDWLLVFDDDVALPRYFLDRFIAVAEHFQLALAQPAQTLMSHAAWRVTRRRAKSLVRETRFVEIGPVTAFRKDVAQEFTPFPDLKFGWGLDLHWAALAQERGWRLGVIDALPVKHETAPVATSYRHDDAIQEAQAFLTGKPFVRADQAQETLVTHTKVDR
jgi:hypothetical protein